MKPRATAITLRLIALNQMAAFVVAFLPDVWIATLHAWFGFGQMPDSAFLRYVIRGGAWSQGAFGVLFWAMAYDVVRYRPLVITVAGLYLVASPTFFFLAGVAGLSMAWRLWDGLCCLFSGGTLLLFCLWPSANTQPHHDGLPGESQHSPNLP